MCCKKGWFAHLLSDYSEAIRLCTRSAVVSRSIGDIGREGDAYNNLAGTEYERGQNGGGRTPLRTLTRNCEGTR